MIKQLNWSKTNQSKQTQVSQKFSKSRKTLMGIAQSFISTIFDRRALLLAIEAQEIKDKEDRGNAIRVKSTHY